METIKYDDLVARLNTLAQQYFVASAEENFDVVFETKNNVDELLSEVSHNVIKRLYIDSVFEFDRVFASKQQYISASELERHCTAQTKIFFVEKYLSKKEVKEILKELKEKQEKERV